MFAKIKKNQFLFEELVKRDFKKKYRKTSLGMLWSVLFPLLNLAVMEFAFRRFFGNNTPNYTIYLFSGNIVLAFFRESTVTGMTALSGNASIFSKINVPKYLFILSKNVSALINFFLTLLVYFVFVIVERIPLSPRMFLLAFPIICLTVFNIGVGMILSAFYIFFRDTEYLYNVFLTLLTYLSAIFYTLDRFSPAQQKFFLLNPIYVYIRYFRSIVIDGIVPGLRFHSLCAVYAMVALMIGAWVYKKYNHKFIYYV